MALFFFLALAVPLASVSLVAAGLIVRGRSDPYFCVTLAVASVAGVAWSLFFTRAQETAPIAIAGAALFTSIVLSVILCCLCQIRAEIRAGRRG